MLNENFVILGSIITLIGGSSYILDTIRGKIQPNRVSWFLWAFAPLVAFLAEIRQGVGLQALLTFTVGFIPAAVFFTSFVNRKSYWKIDKIDLICGALSLLGLLLWFVTKVGNVAILFAIVSDGLASFPTLAKAYNEPQSENSHVFFANAISAVITLTTIKVWNFQNYGFPLYLLVMMGSIGLFIQCKLGDQIRRVFK